MFLRRCLVDSFPRKKMTKLLALPKEVRKIAQHLIHHRYSAYIVGGALRDACLGREIKDWDIATSARPQDVLKLFPRAIETGVKYGTVTLYGTHHNIEITTLRKEDKYVDGRRPERIAFVQDIFQDLMRRDFTMNAMAWNCEKEEWIDPHHGLTDLHQKKLRCVGDPIERFEEDALRIIRALRFQGEYGLTMEPSLSKAIASHKQLVEQLSSERVGSEIDKMCLNGNRVGIKNLWACGILSEYLNFPPMDRSIQLERIFMLLLSQKEDITTPASHQQALNWAFGIFIPMVHLGDGTSDAWVLWSVWLKRFSMDRSLKAIITTLLLWHSWLIGTTPFHFKLTRGKNRILAQCFSRLSATFSCELIFNTSSRALFSERLKILERYFSSPSAFLGYQDLNLNVKDWLVHRKASPGKKLGLCLERVLEEVNLGRLNNESEALSQFLDRAYHQ